MRVSVNGVNMANAYTLLSGMTPFSRWGLPPASEIKFTAKRTRNHLCYGMYLTANGKHEIVIYTHLNTLAPMLETMAAVIRSEPHHGSTLNMSQAHPAMYTHIASFMRMANEH